MGNAD